MKRRLALAPLLLMASAACSRSESAVPPISRFGGQLDSTDSQFTVGMNYDPRDIALDWSHPDTLIVAHSERYSSADVFSATCGGSGIYAVPVTGGIARPLSVGRPACYAVLTNDGVAMDPASSSVIFSTSVPINESRLVRLDLRTGRVDTLRTQCKVYLEHPSVSPDGRFIAAIGLCRDREQPEWGAYMLRSDGSGLRDLAPGSPFTETAPAWSPDRSQLLLAGPRGLVIVDTAGRRQSLPLDGGSLAWSPNGQWIAFTSGDAIYLATPSATDRREVFRNHELGSFRRGWGPMQEGLVAGPIVWSPDSKSLVFSRRFDEGTSIWHLEIGSRRLSQVTVPDSRSRGGA